MACGGSGCLPIGLVWGTLLLTVFAGALVSPAASQSPSPSPAPPPGQIKPTATCHRSAKYQHPADPLRRHAECIDEEFDWDETFAGAWSPMRKRLREVGI
jgi:hypothetical protein